jgi:predicted transcriptional regulator
MKRLTISLPDDLAEALHEESERRNVPESTIVEEALSRYVGPRTKNSDMSALIGFVNSGGVGPFARELDSFLEQSWLDHTENDRDPVDSAAENRPDGSRKSA